MERRGTTLLGVLLIVIGFLFLISKYAFGVEFLNFDSEDFWPIIVLALGLIFEMVYFTTRSKPGFLVPGGILTTIGILFFFEAGTDWRFAAYTWPVYILAVAIGLLQLYLFGYRNRGLLIPVFILTTVAALSALTIMLEVFFKAVDVGLVLPVILILLGVLIFFGRNKQRNNW